MSAPEQVRRYSRDGQWVWERGDWVRVGAPAPAVRPPSPFDRAERRLRVAAVAATLVMIAFVGFALAVAVTDSSHVDRGTATTRQAVDAALRRAAVVQDAVHRQTGRYAGDLATLASAGLHPDDGITLGVLFAGDRRYCLRATSGVVTRYVSSERRTPSATTCR